MTKKRKRISFEMLGKKKTALFITTIPCMPLEQVYVFRRGSEPVISRRYQIEQDPLYREIMGSDNCR